MRKPLGNKIAEGLLKIGKEIIGLDEGQLFLQKKR